MTRSILIVRHAIAEPSGPGVADADRRLTPRGRRRARKAFAGLARIADRPELVLTSPLPRATETAELLARAWGRGRGGIDVAVVDELAPGGSRAKLLRTLARVTVERIAIVGHEPDLGLLAMLLVTGRATPGLTLRKAGACLVEVERRVRAGRASLQWLLRPSLLWLAHS